MDEQQKELEKIEKIMARADFWQRDQDEISRLNQQRACLLDTIDQWKKYYRETEDAKILAEMAMEEDDKPSLHEVEKDVDRLEKEVKALEFHSLLGDPDDRIFQREVVIASEETIKFNPTGYVTPSTITLENLHGTAIEISISSAGRIQLGQRDLND